MVDGRRRDCLRPADDVAQLVSVFSGRRPPYRPRPRMTLMLNHSRGGTQWSRQLALPKSSPSIVLRASCHCGIYTRHQHRSNPDQYGCNVGCLEGVNPFELGAVPTRDGVHHPAGRKA